MSKFNIGDRVRITDIGVFKMALLVMPGSELEKCGLVVGNTGTITATGRVEDGSNDWVSVRTDNATNPTDDDGEGWTFYPNELELVEGGAA